ncbi:MAG TPA: hypothetical protein VGL26_00805, partial [Jatrophihabitans sp.]
MAQATSGGDPHVGLEDASSVDEPAVASVVAAALEAAAAPDPGVSNGVEGVREGPERTNARTIPVIAQQTQAI